LSAVRDHHLLTGSPTEPGKDAGALNIQRYLGLILLLLMLACRAPAPVAGSDAPQLGQPAAASNDNGRYILTVQYGEDGKLAPDHMASVVAALEAAKAQRVEALEGLPTIIVIGPSSAIDAAMETGLVASVQQDSLSAPD